MKSSLLSITILLGACVTPGDEAGDELGQAQQESTSLNGTSLNGTSLNGTSLNGTSLTGTAISATSTTGPPLSGSGVVGSTWNGTASNGTTIKLRIDTALQGTGTNADLWFYGVSYQTATGWSPLCGLDTANVPIKAVTVAGKWSATAADTAYYSSSSTSFTFACRAKTIAKCVELGYKTFQGRTTQLTSCVRLLRGDYCGSGTAYTVDGTLLNLYDNVGVQADTQVWSPEAEWTPTGARCINSNNNARYNLQAGADPKCVGKLKTTTCGTTFANGAILIDELPQ